jgi:hypothetical protein
MKIKKKNYERELQDSYWRGVEAGIKFAKERPDLADNFNVAQTRAIIDKAQKAFTKMGEGLIKVFENM